MPRRGAGAADGNPQQFRTADTPRLVTRRAGAENPAVGRVRPGTGGGESPETRRNDRFLRAELAVALLAPTLR
jgi:hypothetical protein